MFISRFIVTNGNCVYNNKAGDTVKCYSVDSYNNISVKFRYFCDKSLIVLIIIRTYLHFDISYSIAFT